MKRIVAALFALSMGAGVAQGAEISGLLGLYKSHKDKNPAGTLTTNTMSLGARYGLEPQGDKLYFGEISYEGTSYSGTAAPDSHSTMALGGGMMYFLPKIEARFVPYLTGFARYENGKNNVGVETSGLAYGADVGIRFNANQTWFIDFGTQLFKSYLMKTTKTPATAATPKTESTDTEIFGQSTGKLGAMDVGVGMVI